MVDKVRRSQDVDGAQMRTGRLHTHSLRVIAMGTTQIMNMYVRYLQDDVPDFTNHCEGQSR